VDSGNAALDWRADLRRERTFLATSALLFFASAAVTIYRCKLMPGGMPMPGGWTMSMAWMRMGQPWLAADTSFMGMWLVMMVAMMLPSLVPMLLCYRRSLGGQAHSHLGRLTTIAAAGYFFVWALIGAVAYPIGVSLSESEMRSPMFARLVPLATGLVLLLAGGTQFMRWKARRLGRCREATVCEARSATAVAAWQHGLRLGVDCSLCCAGFMIVLLVDDAMSLTTMAVVTVAITIERFVRDPERIARVMGLIIIAVGLLVIARAAA